LRKLPRGEKAHEPMAVLKNRVESVDLQTVDPGVVHQFADELQLDLASLHNAIFETWLNPMAAVRPA
jgi:hypothetical protein